MNHWPMLGLGHDKMVSAVRLAIFVMSWSDTGAVWKYFRTFLQTFEDILIPAPLLFKVPLIVPLDERNLNY